MTEVASQAQKAYKIREGAVELETTAENRSKNNVEVLKNYHVMCTWNDSYVILFTIVHVGGIQYIHVY